MSETPKSTRIQVQPGLALQVIEEYKKYSFIHRSFAPRKGYSLGGLYSDLVSKDTKTESKRQIETESVSIANVCVGTPTPQQLENLGNYLRVLPRVLESKGITVIDGKVKQFHQQVAEVKKVLLETFPDGRVPADQMARAEDFLKPYAVECMRFMLVAIRVSDKPTPGSRQRNDGLYEARQTIRTIYTSTNCSKATLTDILNGIAKSVDTPAVTDVKQTDVYILKPKGKRIGIKPERTTSVTYQGEVIVQKPNSSQVPGIKRMSMT